MDALEIRLFRDLLFICVYSRIQSGRKFKIMAGYVPSSEDEHPNSDISTQHLHTYNKDVYERTDRQPWLPTMVVKKVG
jgi:hypothetical protein